MDRHVKSGKMAAAEITEELLAKGWSAGDAMQYVEDCGIVEEAGFIYSETLDIIWHWPA